jgi:hypothetical protein
MNKRSPVKMRKVRRTNERIIRLINTGARYINCDNGRVHVPGTHFTAATRRFGRIYYTTSFYASYMRWVLVVKEGFLCDNGILLGASAKNERT